MQEFDPIDDFSQDESEYVSVKPDAAIIKFRDGSYHCIRFEHKDEKVVGYETEIDANDAWDNEELNNLDFNQIAFVKISYEFEYDEEQGVLELQLGECVTLTDIHDEYVYIEDIVKNNPEDIISIYISIIENM